MIDQALRLTDGARFVALWLRVAPSAKVTELEAMHTRLGSAYRQTWRCYHALDHIEHCLRQFDGARTAIAGPDEVELALWYHDVVYLPGDVDNEIHSAQWFLRDAGGLLPAAQCERIHALIMATTHHAAPRCTASAWVVDIDLSSFGLPWPDFLHDSHAVRAEMKDQNDERYVAAHSAFLHSLLARPRLYTTEHFHARYEQTARDNITRLLEAYATGVTPQA